MKLNGFYLKVWYDPIFKKFHFEVQSEHSMLMPDNALTAEQRMLKSQGFPSQYSSDGKIFSNERLFTLEHAKHETGKFVLEKTNSCS